MAGMYGNVGLTDPTGGGGVAPWMQDVSAGLGIAGNLYGLYQGAHLQGAAQDVFRQSDPFAGYRPGYGAQLAQLMQDPSSVTKLPGYDFLMSQGSEALARGAAAPGGKGYGSGGMDADLVKYGQGLAAQFYQQQVQTLTGLSGANFAPANPYQALQGMAGAQNIMGQSAGALGGQLPGALSMLSRLAGGFGGGGGGGGAVPGTDLQSMQDWNTFNLYGGTGGAMQQTGAGINDILRSDPSYAQAMGWMGGSAIPSGDFGIAGTPVSPGIPYDQGATGDSLDLSGMFSGFKGAGGQAATPGAGFGTGMQMGGSLAGIGLDLASGRPGAAAINAATMLSRFPGMDPATAKGLGMGSAIGGDILGIMQGVKAGGVSGYGQAGIDAAKLGVMGAQASGLMSSGMAGEVGGALGYAAIPLSVYNFAKNWQGGAVGSDALQGASTGAAIGSVIPGVGTLIGAGVGALVGGLSGLMGNAGEREAAMSHSIDASINKLPAAQQISAASGMDAGTATKYLQSIMSARTNTPGHSTGLEMAFGRNNVAGFQNAMNAQLASAIRSGKIQPGATPDQVYQSIIAPWLKSKGASLDIGTRDSAGNSITPALTGAVQSLIRQYLYGG